MVPSVGVVWPGRRAREKREKQARMPQMVLSEDVAGGGVAQMVVLSVVPTLVQVLVSGKDLFCACAGDSRA